ncbi:hypothetical protein C8R45DRAFT_1047457, partial [Mycena sanguinolenta]
MFSRFAPIIVALVASISPFASAVAVPAGFTSVAANLSSLAATSKFVIASKQFGTQLNVAYNQTGNGAAVILYPASFAASVNQQWLLNNVNIASPTEYTIQSVSSQTFLTWPGEGSSVISWDSPTVVDSTCYPTFTVTQITPGVNEYSIVENTKGGILTAWAQWVEGTVSGIATFQLSADLGSALVLCLSRGFDRSALLLGKL